MAGIFRPRPRPRQPVRWPPVFKLPDAGEAVFAGTRVMDARVAEAYRQPVVTRAGLVTIDFSEAPLRVTDVPFDLFWDEDGSGAAEKFIGVGDLGKVSVIRESAELRAATVQLTLSNVKRAWRAYILRQVYRGRPVRIYEAILNPDTYAVVGATPWFVGLGDTLRLGFGAEVGDVVMTATDKKATWERPRIRRRTDADQQARFPGDRFLEFVDEVRNKEITWPEQPL